MIRPNQLFKRKSIDVLLREMEGDNRLRRALGPVSLSALGIGAIIGAGIFVMTGRAAALDAGPGIIVSYCIAGFGCALAAFCYAEFASMVPVAGSAYTYAYATLGELVAWIIGWDLILEYAMACACVASGWSKYLNVFIKEVIDERYMVPEYLLHDPFTHSGAWFNLPAALITLVVTVILVIGIRESATTNAVLVAVKVSVVLFVIGLGFVYIDSRNWTKLPVSERITPELNVIQSLAEKEVDKKWTEAEAKTQAAEIARQIESLYQGPDGLSKSPGRQKESTAGIVLAFWKEVGKLSPDDATARAKQLALQAKASYKVKRRQNDVAERIKSGEITEEQGQNQIAAILADVGKDLPTEAYDIAAVNRILVAAGDAGEKDAVKKWGLLGTFGLNRYLSQIDDAARSSFMPYGLSGVMLGAAIVFFAFIGFDSISTHSEEAKIPQRDVPIGILASLAICTVLYVLVAAVITGMVPYPTIDPETAVATAFRERAKQEDGAVINAATGLIATGALAGLTSVLLITFLSQARIFLAMARDRLLPPAIFGTVHPRFRTPHISTMLTGGIISVVAALTPITKLEEMVNIGTLLAFVIVCGTVIVLRIERPEAKRPFRCPLVWVVAPLGVLVNLLMMLFLPVETWLRLVGWMAAGMLLYFFYGHRYSRLREEMAG